jgi:glycosyltransferase involved in cell wall biosynthesis
MPFRQDGMLDRAYSRVLPRDSRRILVVDQKVPTPDQDSGSLRMLSILKLLRGMGYRIDFVSEKAQLIGSSESETSSLGIPVHSGFSAALSHLKEEGHSYRFVLLSRPNVAYRYLPLVRAYAIHATVIYDTVDLHWLRLAREAEINGDQTRWESVEFYKRMERLNASCADLVIAITPEEREKILLEEPELRVEIVPNIHRCAAAGRPFHLRKNLMFIGGFQHKPNEDAVRYFARDIFPLISKELPEVVFNIIGSHMPDSVKALAAPSIDPIGYVVDPSVYFEDCRVFVSPLRYGAGMKGKISQSMSHRLPVVTTTIGAEGMALAEGETALIADDPEAFARAVVRLYTDKALWDRIAANSVAHIEKHFSEAAVRTRLERILDSAPDAASRGAGLESRTGGTSPDAAQPNARLRLPKRAGERTMRTEKSF